MYAFMDINPEDNIYTTN